MQFVMPDRGWVFVSLRLSVPYLPTGRTNVLWRAIQSFEKAVIGELCLAEKRY